MPVPFIVWGGLSVVGALTAGGWAFGREVGEQTGKIGPVIVGSVIVYAAYKAASK